MSVSTVRQVHELQRGAWAFSLASVQMMQAECTFLQDEVFRKKAELALAHQQLSDNQESADKLLVEEQEAHMAERARMELAATAQVEAATKDRTALLKQVRII